MDVDRILDGESGYVTTFPDGSCFHYRILNQREFRILDGLVAQGQLHPDFAASIAFKRCFLGDYQMLSEDLIAGYEVSLGRLIIYLSGGSDTEQLKRDLDQAREVYPAQSVLEVMKRMICFAFGSYQQAELDAMTRPEIIRLFVIAEEILKMKLPEYKPLSSREIHTPGTQQQGQQIDFEKENSQLGQTIGRDPYKDEGRQNMLTQKQIQQLKRKELLQRRK